MTRRAGVAPVWNVYGCIEDPSAINAPRLNVTLHIKNSKIEDIWLNKKYKFAREQLLSSKRNFSPCNKCDVSGELIGSKHAEEWKKNK